jgi:hypothetical protein
MKYNIYKCEMKNCTTYFYFNSERHAEIIKEGDFVLIASANTQKLATKIIDNLYNETALNKKDKHHNVTCGRRLK